MMHFEETTSYSSISSDILGIISSGTSSSHLHCHLEVAREIIQYTLSYNTFEYCIFQIIISILVPISTHLRYLGIIHTKQEKERKESTIHVYITILSMVTSLLLSFLRINSHNNSQYMKFLHCLLCNFSDSQ